MAKFGSRKLLIVSNLLMIIFNSTKLIENTACIIIGRFGFGLMVGTSLIALSRAINDTIPPKNSQFYGSFINSGFCMGVFFSNFQGLLIPLDDGNDDDVQKMMDD